MMARDEMHHTGKQVTNQTWSNHITNILVVSLDMCHSTKHFDYCLSTSEGDNQSVRSSAPVVSRCFPGGYNVKLYISRGRLAWWLLAFLHSVYQ